MSLLSALLLWFRSLVVTFLPTLRLLQTRSWAVALLVTTQLVGCNKPAPDAPGKLVVATQTDMAVPGGIDEIKLQVTVDGEVNTERTFELPPDGDSTIPLVVTLDAADIPEGDVTIAAVGLRGGKPKVFAQAVTQVPRLRTSLLQLPLDYLCLDSAKKGDAFFESTCPDIKGKPATCVAGACVAAAIKETSLPEYYPGDVFGGAEGPNSGGSCFDVQACFEFSTPVTPDENCVVDLDVPDGGAPNFALLLGGEGDPQAGVGICGDSGCLVPLVLDARFGYERRARVKNLDGGERWSAQLPPAVCDKLSAGDVRSVVATVACSTRTTQLPTCGPWSSTQNALTVTVFETPDAGATDAGPDAEAPEELNVQIVPVYGWDGGALTQGQVIQLVLEGVPPGTEVEWSSTDESVATVDKHGQVTIVGPGTTIIIATVGGVTAEFVITVPEELLVPWEAEVTSVMIEPGSLTLPKGASAPVTVRATLENGTTKEITDTARWTSEDPEIATVADSRVWANAPGRTIVWAEMNDISAQMEVIVSEAKLDYLFVSPAYVSLPAGLTTQLSATGVYEDGSSLDLTPSVVWTTTDVAVADIDERGLLSAFAEGEVTVIAELDGAEADARVLVTDATLVSLTMMPTTLELLVGQTQLLHALASFSDGQTLDVTSQATWSSSDEEVAKVAGGATSGVKSGQAKITARFGEETTEATVSVRAASLVSLALTPQRFSLPLGARTSLAVEATFEDGSSIDVTNDASWSTTNAAVGTVLDGGFFVTISEGTVTVRASFGGQTAQSTVTVTPATLVALTLQPDQTTLVAGRSEQLRAMASYLDGSTVEVTSYASWLSNNSAASVSSSGVVRGNTKGQATVTATYLGVSATAQITVTDAELVAITVSAAQTSTPVGETIQLSAAASYSDGTTLPATNTVKWSVDNLGTATVSSSGLVTGRNPGQVVVTAQLEGRAGNISLDIVDAVVTGVTLSPAAVSLPKGTSATLEALAQYSDGTSRPVGAGATWSSNQTAIATVSGGVVRAVGSGATLVRLGFQGFTASVEVTVTDAIPTALTVNAAASSAPKGAHVQFTAVVTYSDGTSGPVNNATWSSLTPNTASVSGAGLALALAQGTATIRGSYAGLSNTASFEVTPATISELLVSPTTATTPVGMTVNFTATAVLTDGTTTPANAVTWSSSDALVASVAGGVATGHKPGKVTIRAATSGVSATADLEVTQAVVSSVAITPTSASVALGGTLTFNATATYTDGTLRSVNNFSSSNTNVLAVSSAGVVTTRAVGTANVTASFGGKSAVAAVTVTDAVVTSVTVSPDPASVPVGQKVTLQASAVYSNGHTVDVTNAASWASQAPAVATVQSGVITGVAVGDGTITATYQGKVGKADVKVTPAVVERVAIEADVTAIPLGRTTQLRARAYYSDGTSTLVTSTAQWQRRTGNSVSVAAGLVTALRTGESTITATFDGKESPAVAITVTAAVITGLSVSPLKESVIVGNTVNFAATAIYSDNTSQLVTSSATWTTSDGKFASISAGTARGIAPGEVTITAGYQGQTATATLAVVAATVTRVDVTGKETSLPAGRSLQLSATAVYNNGTSVDVTKDAAWRSGNTTVLTVESGANGGAVKGIRGGTTKVYAAFASVEGNLDVTVTSAVLESIRTVPASLALVEKLSGDLELRASYSDGSTQNVTSSATWTSENTTVATLTGPGKVLAGTSGTTNVVASFSGLSVKAPVTVSKPTAVRLQVTPTTVSLPAGTNTPVSVTVHWSNDTSSDATSLVTWTSTDALVATVSSNKATIQAGSKQGTATLTAAYSGLTATSVVTVTSPTLRQLVIDPATATVTVNLRTQLRAIGTLTDNTTVDLTSTTKWSSSNTAVASVPQAGLVSGVAAGTATITGDYQGTIATATVTVVAPKLTSVKVDPESFVIEEQKTYTLKAVAEYDNGQAVDVTQQATWTSGNSNVISFNGPGVAYGVGAGDTLVTARYDGVSGTSKALVNAVPVYAIAISPERPTVVVNGTIQLQARAYDAAGAYLGDYTTRVTWQTEGQAARVNSTGLVTGLAVGSASVRATYQQLETKVAVTVTSNQLAVEKLQVYPGRQQVYVGIPFALTAVGYRSDGSQVDVTNQVTWTTDNGAIPVDAKTGVVNALKPDSTAKVSATYDKLTDSAAVTSLTTPSSYLTFSPNVLRLTSGTSGLTKVLLTNANGTQDVTSSVSLQVDDTKVATATYSDRIGLRVNGVAPGQALLSVQYGKQKLTAEMPISVSTK